MTATAAPQHPRPIAAARFAPMGTGRILRRSVSLIAQNPGPVLVGAIAVPFAINLVALIIVVFAQARSDAAEGSDEALSFASDSLSASNMQSLVSLATTVFAQAYVLMSLREATLGNRAPNATIFAGLRRVWGSLVVWALIGVSAAIALATVCAVIAFVGIVAASIAGVEPDDPAATRVVIPGIAIAAIAAAIPVIWAMTRLSLAPALIVLDRASIGGAMRRSWQLTRPRFWKALGVQAVLVIAIGAAWALVAAAFLGPYVFAAGGDMNAIVEPLDSEPFILALLAIETLVAAIGVVLLGNAVGLLAIDARMRDDWLAASLDGYANARLAGVPAAALYDPFMSVPEAFAPYSGPAFRAPAG